ncbi:MAG: amidohydrolase family protein [Oscillospiraceae bacterium]|nr:amidohydrolase family protein [Oscillospiraceae bacterium]
MLIYNARLYTMHGGIIDGGWIRFENGLIAGIGEPDTCPAPDGGDTDAAGAPVTPGLIDAHCHIGLMEDSQSFEDTDDANEWSEPITPHLRALDAVNPLDRMFSEALRGGVTAVCSGPGSLNPIGGRAVALKTYGRRVDDMVLSEPAALKIAFGENPRLRGKKDKPPHTRMGAAALIREAFFTAIEYRDGRGAFDMVSESLLPVLSGELRVHAHAHRACDIFTALRIGAEFGFRPVIIHATESETAADLLGGVSVITGPSFGTRSKPELRSLSCKTPGALSAAGLKPCICTDAPELPIDSLALMAAIAVRDGMRPYEALRAITWYPAVTLGIEGRAGALKPGLDADAVLWNTDPLDAGARPDAVFVSGVRRA